VLFQRKQISFVVILFISGFFLWGSLSILYDSESDAVFLVETIIVLFSSKFIS
jgi:hypothetical protein